jgi:hypothetical protein
MTRIQKCIQALAAMKDDDGDVYKLAGQEVTEAIGDEGLSELTPEMRKHLEILLTALHEEAGKHPDAGRAFEEAITMVKVKLTKPDAGAVRTTVVEEK